MKQCLLLCTSLLLLLTACRTTSGFEAVSSAPIPSAQVSTISEPVVPSSQPTSTAEIPSPDETVSIDAYAGQYEIYDPTATPKIEPFQTNQPVTVDNYTISLTHYPIQNSFRSNSFASVMGNQALFPTGTNHPGKSNPLLFHFDTLEETVLPINVIYPQMNEADIYYLSSSYSEELEKGTLFLAKADRKTLTEEILYEVPDNRNILDTILLGSNHLVWIENQYKNSDFGSPNQWEFSELKAMDLKTKQVRTINKNTIPFHTFSFMTLDGDMLTYLQPTPEGTCMAKAVDLSTGKTIKNVTLPSIPAYATYSGNQLLVCISDENNETPPTIERRKEYIRLTNYGSASLYDNRFLIGLCPSTGLSVYDLTTDKIVYQETAYGDSGIYLSYPHPTDNGVLLFSTGFSYEEHRTHLARLTITKNN